MDTYMHKTMASVASLEKIEIIRSEEFMASEARLKFLKKMIILGPKTAILGPQFCRILVLGPHFWWSGGPPWIRPWIGSTERVKIYCQTGFKSDLIQCLLSRSRTRRPLVQWEGVTALDIRPFNHNMIKL